MERPLLSAAMSVFHQWIQGNDGDMGGNSSSKQHLGAVPAATRQVMKTTTILGGFLGFTVSPKKAKKKHLHFCKRLFLLVGREGFEPSTN
jgi:hypothetical protein